jgi:undecaprenyl-diphosphooligosaccharide--protein glycosyltransferase
MYMGYMFLFHRKDSFTYNSILLISIGLLNLQWGVQLIAIGILFMLMQRNLLKIQHIKIASILAILGFLYFGNVFHLILMKVALYFSRGVESEGLKFYQVSQTVREAGIIPFDVMANRVSGSIPGVLSAFVGYLILVVRHRPMILALPLIGIGVFSLVGGLRFTVYAVPVAALSSVYLFYFLAKFIENRLAAKTIMVGLTALLLYPNIRHIIEYKVPTVFNSSEVETLEQFSKMGSDKDYVVTWWDYGYPIWYYGNKNTLIDGGKHNHDNFVVSEILTSTSQFEAARLSRIAVETYVDSNYSIISDTLFHNKKPNQLDPNSYLEQLRYGDVQLPNATRDVYLYLPYRMLDILPTVAVFSNLDLNTGEQYRRPFFFVTSRFNDTGNTVVMGRGIVLDKRKGVVRIGQREIPLRSFYSTTIMQDGKVKTTHNLMSMQGKLSVIFMASYRKFLIVDEKMLNSNFIQMFVLGNYDHDLFEPALLSPFVQIYKLKV